MGLDSINDIFRKDHNGKYTNRIAELAQKILSYVFVNQDLKSSIVYSKPFYDKDLAGWLLYNYKVFINRYQHRPYNQMNYASKVEKVLNYIKNPIHDLCKLGLIKQEIVGKRSGTTDIITVYSYTIVGYVIALLIELLELGKRKSISQQIYDIFDSYLKDDASSYATFYSLLFKKYMQNGIFDEFLIDVLLYRLTQVQGLITKDNLFASMDLRTFADPKKARIHAKILLDTLDELDPNIRQLLFHDIKLQYQEAMRRRLKIYHRDFEQRCFELRDQPDVIILEAICLNCDSYLLIDCQTIYYIKKSNLSPHTPILGIKCSECKQDNCILIP